MTHPNPVCLHANALFAIAIAHSVSTGCGCQELYRHIEAWAREMDAEVTLLESISGASMAPPSDYLHQQGWVLIAFRGIRHRPDKTDGLE